MQQMFGEPLSAERCWLPFHGVPEAGRVPRVTGPCSGGLRQPAEHPLTNSQGINNADY